MQRIEKKYSSVREMQKRNMWDMHANENKLMQTNCDENCKWVCKVWKQIVLCFEQYANENKLMQTNCDENCKWVCKMWNGIVLCFEQVCTEWALECLRFEL